MPEITKTAAAGGSRSRLFWLVFAAATAAVYFFGLTIPLVGPDEPRYSQVAREMFERGDWVTPTLGGAHWFEKPALLYWVQIASFHLFGVSEFSARFGSAIFGLGTISFVWLAGRVAYPKDDRANWIALVTATSIGLIAFARGASFDIILTFPITGSLVCYFFFDHYHRTAAVSAVRKAYVPLFGFYVFAGMGLLAKGLVGAIFPFAIVGFYHLLSRRVPDRRFLYSLFWGTIVAAAVASMWYLPMYLRHGWEFVDEFFIQHHFQRYTSNKYFHPQPFYFFLWVLPLMTLPWLAFFAAGLWSAVKRALAHRSSEPYTDVKDLDWVNTGSGPDPGSSLLIFALAWLVVPVAFFSFSGSKLPGYILPALPAATVLGGDCVWRFVQNGRGRRLAVVATAIGMYAGVILTLMFVAPAFARSDSVKAMIELADSRGLGTSPVMSLHTVSHNAEFYAAGRIVRADDGKQRKFLGSGEVVKYIRDYALSNALVIVPKEYLHDLTSNKELESEILGENGEVMIAVVSAAN
jgi:4-amino-4-deoxy-L-arabinose transferase-like glycosyltransferase